MMKIILLACLIAFSAILMGCRKDKHLSDVDLVLSAFDYIYKEINYDRILYKDKNELSFYLQDGAFSEIIYKKYIDTAFPLKWYDTDVVIDGELFDTGMIFEKFSVYSADSHKVIVEIQIQRHGSFIVEFIPYNEKWVPVNYFMGNVP